jgi:hypothetical protein
MQHCYELGSKPGESSLSPYPYWRFFLPSMQDGDRAHNVATRTISIDANTVVGPLAWLVGKG